MLRGLLGQVGTLLFKSRDPLRSRRREQRIPCDLLVTCDLGEGRAWEARLLEVSASGLRLRCDARLKRLQSVHISPLGGFLGVRCSVRWVRQGEAGLAYDDTPDRIASSWVQITLRRADQLHRRDRRLPAGVEVELQDQEGKWLSHGVLLDLSLRGALVRSEERLEDGTSLRLRIGASLYLLARVVGNPAPGRYNVTFFPGYKTDEARLRQVLLGLLEAIERGEAPALPPPEPVPSAPALAESLVSDFQIQGRLSLGGSLAEVVTSPLPDFNFESLLADVALEEAVEVPVPAAASPLEEWEARRGWAAQMEPGEYAGTGESGWWLDLILQGNLDATIHAVVASLALGGTAAVRQVLMGTRLAVSLADALGVNQPGFLQLVRWAALLRDVGEVAHVMARQTSPQREAIAAFLQDLKPPREGEELAGLRVPGKLFLSGRAGLGIEELQRHTGLGRALVMDVPGLERLAPVLQAHHERWDGRGPLGLAGSAIPLVARCVTVADFHATMRVRGLSVDEATRLIEAGAGSWFDPDVVSAFVKLAAPGP